MNAEQRKLENHRFSFEGGTGMLADHLVTQHGVPQGQVAHLRNGMTQGHWIALDDIHKRAHAERVVTVADDMQETAKRVLSFVRARQLLSNISPEEIMEVSIMIPGSANPMTFTLLSSDLLALAEPHIDRRCTARVPDNTGVTKARTCGLTLGDDGQCPRPEEEHVR